MFDSVTAATERRRGPGRPWPKGVSGNPAGQRPKLADPGALARRHTTACIRTLVAALSSTDTAAAVHAAEVLLAQGFGLPSRHVALTMPPLLSMVVRGASDEEIEHSNGAARSWNA